MKVIVKNSGMKKSFTNLLKSFCSGGIDIKRISPKDYVKVRYGINKYTTLKKPIKHKFSIFSYIDPKKDVVIDSKAIAAPFDIKFQYDTKKELKTILKDCEALCNLAITVHIETGSKSQIKIDGVKAINGFYTFNPKDGFSCTEAYYRVINAFFDGNPEYIGMSKEILDETMEMFGIFKKNRKR